MQSLVSVVIRTLNEDRHLEELLVAIRDQSTPDFDVEVVLVDSGSTDSTLSIAKKHGCRITHIEKSKFTFGRALNIGCEFAKGDTLVFVSGHCIPCDKNWLVGLRSALLQGCAYVYGRQVARDTTKFSENQIFRKYFPEESRIPQVGFFCNNANAAIQRKFWEEYQFNEELSGCEDMYLARSLIEDGHSIGYCAEAAVYHIHDEPWQSVLNRYEREAVALRKIMPEVHVGTYDLVKFITVGILKDFRAAAGQGVFWREARSIVAFRFAQYYGAYKGHGLHRQISHEAKTRYFYPRVSNMNVSHRYRDLMEKAEAAGPKKSEQWPGLQQENEYSDRKDNMNYVLVTGSNGGIGTAIVEVLTDKGFAVIGSDVGPDVNGLESYVECNLSDLVAYSSVREKFAASVLSLVGENRLAALVNNAAVLETASASELKLDDLSMTMNINVIAAFALAQDFLPALKRAKGTVVNIGSIHAKLTKPAFISYATSKAALRGLTQSLAVDCGEDIRVNMIEPAAIATPMLLAGFVDNPKALEGLEQYHPVGRLGLPVEVAELVAYLVSDASSFMTGSVIEFNGGIGSRLHDPV